MNRDRVGNRPSFPEDRKHDLSQPRKQLQRTEAFDLDPIVSTRYKILQSIRYNTEVPAIAVFLSYVQGNIPYLKLISDHKMLDN